MSTRLLPSASRAAILVLLALSTACATRRIDPAPTTAQRADSAVLVTSLGSDMLAIERIVRRPGRVDAEVLMRAPRTTLTRYVFEQSMNGAWSRMEATTELPGTGVIRREVVSREGEGWRVETFGDSAQTRLVSGPLTVLPFIDMVHWPFELALERLRVSTSDRVTQPLLSGTRLSDFVLARVGGDSATITHPTRGTMRARVDATGHILGLDASETTRAVRVERRAWFPIDEIMGQWVANDRAGRSFGSLSGRGEVRRTVQGANIQVDYGQPAKRGREVWGSLVPYGQVWRTGANLATHFTTDRTLRFGTGADTLRVPAGTYTLFTIPDREGGVLIVNRQTGQTGTAYDASRDLGRVRLRMVPSTTEVETFTIDVAPVGTGGELRLFWDRSAFVAPFEVR